MNRGSLDGVQVSSDEWCWVSSPRRQTRAGFLPAEFLLGMFVNRFNLKLLKAEEINNKFHVGYFR